MKESSAHAPDDSASGLTEDDEEEPATTKADRRRASDARDVPMNTPKNKRADAAFFGPPLTAGANPHREDLADAVSRRRVTHTRGWQFQTIAKRSKNGALFF